MVKKSTGCPNIKDLEDYFLQNLDGEKTKKIGEHLYSCNICIDEARKVLNIIQKLHIIKADPILGATHEKVYDTVKEYKCADDGQHGIVELETVHKRYRVTLRPIEESDNLALLELQVLDRSIQGNLLILFNGQMEKAEVDKNGLAYITVRSDIDLRELRICNEDL